MAEEIEAKLSLLAADFVEIEDLRIKRELGTLDVSGYERRNAKIKGHTFCMERKTYVQ